MEIKVAQGERQMWAQNQPLGNFELTGLPPAPRGVPKIEVTFDIDANGIVHVSAKDQGTGKEQSMTISGGSALSKDDIDRMVKDAEQYAEEDAKRREAVESRNQADSLVYSTEKFLSENDEKLPEDVKTEVQADVDELKKLLEDEDTDKDTFTAAISKLGESSQKMGAAMYAASEAEAAAVPRVPRAPRPPTRPTTTSSTPRSWTRTGRGQHGGRERGVQVTSTPDEQPTEEGRADPSAGEPPGDWGSPPGGPVEDHARHAASATRPAETANETEVDERDPRRPDGARATSWCSRRPRSPSARSTCSGSRRSSSTTRGASTGTASWSSRTPSSRC